MLMRFEFEGRAIWVRPERVVLVKNCSVPNGSIITLSTACYEEPMRTEVVDGSADEVATRINAALEARKPC